MGISEIFAVFHLISQHPAAASRMVSDHCACPDPRISGDGERGGGAHGAGILLYFLPFLNISGKYEEPTLEVKYLTSTQRILKERLGVELTPPPLPPPRRTIESGGGWPDPGRGIGG